MTKPFYILHFNNVVFRKTTHHNFSDVEVRYKKNHHKKCFYFLPVSFYFEIDFSDDR